jgi:serine/threonine-protein kinase
MHVPPGWEGKPLTLAIPEFEGDAVLYANGRVVPDRRLGFAHAWRIDDAARDSAEIPLRLELAPATWPRLGTPPRLSATPDGDAWYRFIRASAYHGSYVVTSITGFLCLLYSGLFLLDRGRLAHGWFALQAAAGVFITSRVLLDTPRLIGGWLDLQVQIGGGAFGLVAAAFFTSAYFHTRTPPRRWWLLPLVCVPFSFLRSIAMTALYAKVSLTILLIAFFWITSILLRIRGTNAERSSATTLAVGWGTFIVLACPDFLVHMGFGEVGGGFRGGVIGMGAFATLQATLLLRDHVRSLRAADARAKELEAQSREVSLLNVELRRQIADRSQQLAEAVARIGRLAPNPRSLQEGDVVHERYRIIRAIGRGGMGAVYEVARIADGKRFALKVLTGATTGSALARLAREAQIAAKVSHERLVLIADVDVSETGALYIVMELVEGATLSDLHERYGDARWALPILRQIAVGLAVLHAERVVHRDLKPGNVLLARPGDLVDPGVKIADFGIARVGSEDEHRCDGNISPYAATASLRDRADEGLTETGIVLGTPMYMAPELAGGTRDARPASDIWAFGVIAHELLTGALPFALPPVLDAIAGRPWHAPLALDPAKYDAAVAALVVRCLDGAPGARPTAEECVAALRVA